MSSLSSKLMVEAGKVGKSKDLSEFDKLGCLDWDRASPKLQVLWGVPGLQWSVSIKSGPRKEQC